MTKFTKLYSQIVNNPKDVKFDDLDKLLRHHGFMCRKPGGGSSHYNYYHLDLPDVLTIPYNRPIKAIYVKLAIKAIQQLKERGE
ncbi:conserved hypothetical protein [Desulforamulus reducens MI-1]|uniref:Type II toxin-antitoxin system HicA family toxin n=1 Tax=Desulforamulus reducens (strain ATCC BAA-1160 / DSM 100696 / MI-1) TaxID=349161 RepID=A4J784_DESRM|nr:hypothetical protein [Desulforamulus reducens]ABO50937.1 conserved hypothetical protein [Desulforamulus reducens MI-1]